MSGTTKGVWARPDAQTWTSAFPNVPPKVATVPQADCAVHIFGDGWTCDYTAHVHGVSEGAVRKHLRLLAVKAAKAIAERRPAVTSTTVPVLTRPSLDGLQRAALAYILEFETYERLLRQAPTPPMRRTGHTGLKVGRDPWQAASEAAALPVDTRAQRAQLSRAAKARKPTRRNEYHTLYHEGYEHRRIQRAETWQQIVMLDDEAPANVLVPLGLLDVWQRRGKPERRKTRRAIWLPDGTGVFIGVENHDAEDARDA